MKNVILDSQILSTLQACPRLTDFRFGLHLQSNSGKSNSLECGSIVHSVLEHFYKSKMRGKSRSDSIDTGMRAGMAYIQGKPICSKCSNSELFEDNVRCVQCGHEFKPDDYGPLRNTPEDSDKYIIGWRWALETCTQYFDFYKNDSWIPISSEHVHSKLIYEDDDMRIMWKAKEDLGVDTNNGIYPVDHKTSKQRRDTLKLNNQFMGLCVVRDTRMAMINKIGFQTSLKSEEKFTRVSLSYSSDSLVEWCNFTVPFYARMMLAYNDADYWPPNYTHCENKYGKCGMVEICESDRGMREEVIRMNFIRGKEWDIGNEDD